MMTNSLQKRIGSQWHHQRVCICLDRSTSRSDGACFYHVVFTDDCSTSKKACANCSCGRAEAEAAGIQMKLTQAMIDNPQSACGSVRFPPRIVLFVRAQFTMGMHELLSLRLLAVWPW